ncbi:MAG: hypothetical protein J6Q84_04045 [Kiritimatiellae bacterium]|nr:hypothetical protein [Kiritimatiellia bacterium]
MKPFSAFILFSVFLSCIAGCVHERRAYFVSVEGGIKPITTRNRYTLVDAKHKAETANVDVMSGSTYELQFTNENLKRFQPGVFSDDGVPFVLKWKELKRDRFDYAPLSAFTLCTIPGFGGGERSCRNTIEVQNNPDAHIEYDEYWQRRHAIANTPISYLFYRGNASAPKELKEYSFIQEIGAGDSFSRDEGIELKAYAIAALLKKMEDNGLIAEANNKHADRNETFQNSVSDKYEIVEFEKNDDCAYRYSFALKRRDSGSVAVRESRELKKILRAMIREDYLLSFPDVSRSVVIDFPKFSLQNGRVVGNAVALTFSVASLEYDSHRRRGVMRIRIGENQFEDARKYARKNIESIARDKNIALDAKTIPPSAVFYLEGEKLNGGMLEISFRVE